MGPKKLRFRRFFLHLYWPCDFGSERFSPLTWYHSTPNLPPPATWDDRRCALLDCGVRSNVGADGSRLGRAGRPRPAVPVSPEVWYLPSLSGTSPSFDHTRIARGQDSCWRREEFLRITAARMKTVLKFRLSHPALMVLVASLATLSWMKADSPLEERMQHMKKAYKELSLGLEKPQESGQSAYLSLAQSIKTSALQAREFVPKLAAKLPPDQKAAMVKAYQADIDGLVVSLDGLIRNLKDSKWEEARKDMANLKNEMRDGHREFRKD